jgi:predicted porin
MWRAAFFGFALLLAYPASTCAADGGKGCCQDLEAVIAELEATALHKGTSKVSLQIYGQVNRAILVWNDGIDTGVTGVDNSTSSTRLGLIGQAAIRPGLAAGYRVEFEFPAPASSEMFNPSDVTHAEHWTSFALRQAYWFVSDQTLGTISVGQQWPATGTLTLINLGSQMNDAALHFNNAFSIGLSIAGGIFSDLKWGHIAHNVDTLRGSYVRYDTASLLGFTVSASVGEQESWDVALRYQLDGQAFRLAAGIGYRYETASLLAEAKGGVSLLHNPTGLYASAAAALREDDRSSIIGRPLAHFHYAQAGMSRKWLTYGPTTIYGDFGVYRNFNVGELLSVDPHTNQLVVWGTLAETEVVRWGYGIEQSFEDTGVLLYAQAHHFDPTVVGFPCDPNPPPNQCGGDPNNLVTLPMRGWSGYVAGMRIRF